MASSLEDTRMALLQERDMIPINFELVLNHTKDTLCGVMGYKSRSELSEIEKYVKRIRNGRNAMENPSSFSKICLDFHGKDLLIAIYYLGILDGLRNELIKRLKADKVMLAGQSFRLQQKVFILENEVKGWKSWEQKWRREEVAQLEKNRMLRRKVNELNGQLNQKQSRKQVIAKPKTTNANNTGGPGPGKCPACYYNTITQIEKELGMRDE